MYVYFDGSNVDYNGDKFGPPVNFLIQIKDESENITRADGFYCEYLGDTPENWTEFIPAPDEEPEKPILAINTREWLRSHLGTAAEMATRAYGLDSANAQYIQVQVFMEAIRDRMGDVLYVSDDDYKNGVSLIYSVGIIDQDNAERLLALGGHTL